MAQHDSGEQRTIRQNEEVHAEHPIRADVKTVIFEQDNESFSVDTNIFRACTILKSDLKDTVEELLDHPYVPGTVTPPKCKTKGCGHQKQEHGSGNGLGACRAMIVVSGRRLNCPCQVFEP